jgi:hypothetical protein
MFRRLYIIAMGACVGAIAAASCGHPAFWIGTGLALGSIWSRLSPQTDECRNSVDHAVAVRSWLNQVVALRRVSCVIGVA